jgi:thymidylate kinase
MGLEEGQLAAERSHSQVRGAGATATSPRPRHARGPMVVEFIGIPGSGKTTLCTAIDSELRRDGFKVITEHEYFRWMKRPLSRKIGSLITHGVPMWYFVLHLYWFLYHGTSLRGRALLGMGFHLTCMRVWLSQMVSSKEPIVVLLDGFAWFRLTNRLRDYPATALGTAQQLRRTVELFYPRCDIHWIFKTIPVEVAVQRISRRMLRDRAPKGIETSSPERRHLVLSRQMQLYQLVCDAIRSLYGDNVSWIDGAEPIPEQVRRIKETIPYAPQQETVAAATYGIFPSMRPEGHGRICEY